MAEEDKPLGGPPAPFDPARYRSFADPYIVPPGLKVACDFHRDGRINVDVTGIYVTYDLNKFPDPQKRPEQGEAIVVWTLSCGHAVYLGASVVK